MTLKRALHPSSNTSDAQHGSIEKPVRSRRIDVIVDLEHGGRTKVESMLESPRDGARW